MGQALTGLKDIILGHEKEVAEHQQGMAEAVREYVRSQLDVWQRLPWLALREKIFHEDESGQVSDKCLLNCWQSDWASQLGFYCFERSFMVNCASGELFCWNGEHDEPRPISDDELLRYVSSDKLEMFDGSNLVEALLKSGTRGLKYLSADEAERRRVAFEDQSEKTGLGRIFDESMKLCRGPLYVPVRSYGG